MLKKKKIKKSIWRKFNMLNMSVTAVSVLSSFLIVSTSSSVQEYQVKQASKEPLFYSVQRVADAFDLYNTKRFSKE